MCLQNEAFFHLHSCCCGCCTAAKWGFSTWKTLAYIRARAPMPVFPFPRFPTNPFCLSFCGFKCLPSICVSGAQSPNAAQKEGAILGPPLHGVNLTFHVHVHFHSHFHLPSAPVPAVQSMVDAYFVAAYSWNGGCWAWIWIRMRMGMRMRMRMPRAWSLSWENCSRIN